jgi:hypothetical protein
VSFFLTIAVERVVVLFSNTESNDGLLVEVENPLSGEMKGQVFRLVPSRELSERRGHTLIDPLD